MRKRSNWVAFGIHASWTEYVYGSLIVAHSTFQVIYRVSKNFTLFVDLRILRLNSWVYSKN